MMPFSFFLALRYLLPKRSPLTMSITLFSIMGVMLGVGSLVVVISVFNGFEKKVKEELLKMEPHVVATEAFAEIREGVKGPNWRQVAAKLREATSAVVSASPVVEAPATFDVKDIQGEKRLEPITITAVDPQTTPLKEKATLVAGSFELETGDNAIISEALAVKFNLMIGSKMTVQSFRNAENTLRMIEDWEKLPKDQRKDAETFTAELKEAIAPAELTVTGIFDSLQRPDMVITPLHIGQEMAGKADGISYLSISTPDPFNVGLFEETILGFLPSNWQAESWRMRHKAHFDAIESERGMIKMVLAIILVVAGFCIAVTLITIAVQKAKEIGIISSLGASWRQIVGVFVCQGIVVGVIGVLLGLVAGLQVLKYRMAVKNGVLWLTGMEIMDPRVYGVAEIPCDIRQYDIIVILISALVISAIAALIPAFIAAWRDPAKSLRSE